MITFYTCIVSENVVNYFYVMCTNTKGVINLFKLNPIFFLILSNNFIINYSIMIILIFFQLFGFQKYSVVTVHDIIIINSYFNKFNQIIQNNIQNTFYLHVKLYVYLTTMGSRYDTLSFKFKPHKKHLQLQWSFSSRSDHMK